MNVTTISTVSNATQAAVESIQNHGQKHQTTYKIEMLDDSMASDDDDDDLISSDGSIFDENELAAVQDDLANQLAAAGPVGVAAAAAIASSKKRKRQHSFETNPSVRKRQQNRLLRKLRGIIYEFTGRVGKQAVVLVATPGKPNTSYKVFGAKPLEDVVRNLKNIVMDELENALAQQAPPPPQEDPSLFELPPLIIDGIPTPVEKMTQAQLRAFIPLMLKYSTGRGKPGWGREATRPPWWPKELPWANVRMDARSEDDKQKISWTHALRKIVINCYKYHGREDLLPTFADEDDKVSQLISHEEEEEEEEVIVQPVNNNNNTTTTIQTVTNAPTNHATTTNVRYTTQTVLSTIQNADGTVSLIQVDPNNPIITLPDGTTAQVQGVATLHQGEGGATIQTVQSLADVNGHENMTVDLTEATVAQDGQIYITTEDGQGYPVSVSNMITVPVSASMYQSMMANIQQIHTNSDGTVCITPMQVDASNNNNNHNNGSASNNHNSNSDNGGNEDETSGNGNDNVNVGANAAGVQAVAPQQFQCYSIMAASPIATAAQRLLANSGLVQTLNFNNSNSNNNNNNSSSANSDNSSSCNNNNTSSTNNNNNNHNIRCQIINASSLVAAAAATNNSSQQQQQPQQCQQQQQSQHHHLQQQQHHQAIINQQSLTNVLQNAGAKVFIAANPAHLNLTAAAAANLLNNNDATTANNNHINVNANNNGQIKFATALPIVVATAPNNAQHHHHPAAAAIIAATAGMGVATTSSNGGNKQHRRRSHGGSTIADTAANTNNNYLKSGHKRRKHNLGKVVVPIKLEEGVDINNTSTSSAAISLLHSANDGGTTNHNHSVNAAEGLLNIQIVDDTPSVNGGGEEDNGSGCVGSNGGAAANTNPTIVAVSSRAGGGGGGAGGIVGVCSVGNVRVGNRLLSVDVSKSIKLESLDN
ncbi:DNA-binding protein Ewg isoform X4 [Musca autumnalis]|uniref:DNA-binding protein Ewg isoform X4 n=1 Tax=Musca autumnalis TaxID=221902 RepID=UPI003CF7E764